MPDDLDNFDTLTKDIAARLNDFCQFDVAAPPIPVLTENLSDLNAQLQLQLTAKSGLAIIVRTPEFDLGDTPEIIRPSVAIQVVENVLQNQSAAGSGLTALRGAISVYLALIQADWAPTGWSLMKPTGRQKPIRLITSGQVTLKGGANIDKLVAYEVVLGTWGQFSYTAEDTGS